MTPSTATLWNDYRQRLHAYVAKRTGRPADADDIVQNIFINIQRHPPQVREVAQLEGWLWRVTKNALADYWRQQKPTQPLDDDWAETLAEDEPGTENPWQHLTCCLLTMVHDLPDKYREAVVLADLEERKHKDIAALIGISESGVKSRVKRGREQLRDLLVSCCTDCQCEEKTPEEDCCHRRETQAVQFT